MYGIYSSRWELSGKQHKVKLSAVFVMRLSPRAVYFYTKWQCFKRLKYTSWNLVLVNINNKWFSVLIRCITRISLEVCQSNQRSVSYHQQTLVVILCTKCVTIINQVLLSHPHTKEKIAIWPYEANFRCNAYNDALHVS